MKKATALEDIGQSAANLVDRYNALCGPNPSWLSYHFNTGSRFGNSLVWALAECETLYPGLGARLIDDLYAVKYVSAKVDSIGWMARFEELIQKLAEVLVAKALCLIDWPEGTEIELEPLNEANKRRPDFAVLTPQKTYLFEVKCPSFIKHQRERHTNEHHLPVRSFMKDMPFLRDAKVTLPRDNPVKDFLVSAQSKFENFCKSDFEAFLVVVWDEHMYEAIGALSHPMSGLLTPNTWYKKNGLAVTFPDISGVIVINRLEQLKAGAQEIAAYYDTFQLGGPDALPNTWHPNTLSALEARLEKAFDTSHFERVGLAADYAMVDYIAWYKPYGAARTHLLRMARKQSLLRSLMQGCSPFAIANYKCPNR